MSYRHAHFSKPLGQFASVFRVQGSGEKRADVGRAGAQLTDKRTRVVAVAGQRRF